MTPGASARRLTAISGNTMVGYYEDSLSNHHGFIYDGSTFTTVDGPGAVNTELTGVSGGAVVGSYDYGDPNDLAAPYPFVYGSTVDFQSVGLGLFPTGVSGNTLFGYYPTFVYDQLQEHGFTYDGSTLRTVDFPGGPDTTITGISGGIVVGNGAAGGFIYDGSAFTTLEFPGAQATGVNGISGNTVVGTYYDQLGHAHGFIAQVPEPSAIALVSVACACVAGWAWRRKRLHS